MALNYMQLSSYWHSLKWIWKQIATLPHNNHSHATKVPNLKTTHQHKRTHSMVALRSSLEELNSNLERSCPCNRGVLHLHENPLQKNPNFETSTKKFQLWNIHTQTTWIAVNKFFLQTWPTFKLHIRIKYAFLVNKCFNSK
jgi:hypothetical protein